MTPEVFVREFEELKEYIGEGYFSEASEISRISRLQIAGFSPSQIELTKELFPTRQGQWVMKTCPLKT